VLYGTALSPARSAAAQCGFYKPHLMHPAGESNKSAEEGGNQACSHLRQHVWLSIDPLRDVAGDDQDAHTNLPRLSFRSNLNSGTHKLVAILPAFF